MIQIEEGLKYQVGTLQFKFEINTSADFQQNHRKILYFAVKLESPEPNRHVVRKKNLKGTKLRQIHCRTSAAKITVHRFLNKICCSHPGAVVDPVGTGMRCLQLMGRGEEGRSEATPCQVLGWMLAKESCFFSWSLYT